MDQLRPPIKHEKLPWQKNPLTHISQAHNLHILNRFRAQLQESQHLKMLYKPFFEALHKNLNQVIDLLEKNGEYQDQSLQAWGSQVRQLEQDLKDTRVLLNSTDESKSQLEKQNSLALDALDKVREMIAGVDSTDLPVHFKDALEAAFSKLAPYQDR